MTQKQALDILKMGHSVYITGPAGSGKTYLLNQYINYLKQHEVEVGITASTGIAATHMGGVTIHSWTGMGIKSFLTPHDLDSLVQKKYLYKRLEKVRVLIIDEISMLHDFRLDLINLVLQTFKKNDKPFGGVQLILCGDFFQLPPVSRFGEPESRFVYHSQAWNNADLKVCYLEEQFRQTDDHALTVLNSIRGNTVTDEIKSHLNECFKENKKLDKEYEIAPTRLYTHNIDVDDINEQALNALEEAQTTYTMTSRGNEVLVSILKKSCLAPENLRLKKGARVMFIKNNFEKGYVNGTLGEVFSFNGANGGPIVRITKTGKLIELEKESWKIEEEGTTKAEINQYPLRLAWAITVHKSQGMSLDAVEVDLSKSFERGMGYVALSRVRTLKGLTILGLNEEALKVHDEILEYDEVLKEKSAEVVGEVFALRVEEIAAKQKACIEDFSPLKMRKSAKNAKIPTHHLTRELLDQELPIIEIAKKRQMTEETILGHIEKLVEEDRTILDRILYLKKLVSAKHFTVIAEIFEKKFDELKDWRLAPVKDYIDKNKKQLRLSPAPTYRDLQLVRIFVKGEQG